MAYINGSSRNERLNGTNNSDSIWGNGGNDTLNGAAGNDLLYGGSGNDSVLGGSGGDNLYGGAGNDNLEGGLGNDYLAGGSGADIYYFSRGDGQDYINNYDYDGFGYNKDKIQFAVGIAPSDVVVSKNGYDLVLKIKNTTDQITVAYYFYNNASSPYAIENIYFANGTVWDINAIKQQFTTNQVINGGDFSDYLVGAAGNDTIKGNGGSDYLLGDEGNDSIEGGNGNDYVLGQAGNDNLDGGSGSDYVFGQAGNDILKGGVGNDYLMGGDGADVYHFARGDGQDIINNYDYDAPGINADTLQFASGINETDVNVTKDWNDLVLSINNSTDSVRISNYFYNNSNASYPIENIRFATGSVWTTNTIKQKLSEPKSLNGTDNNDTLTGGLGDDTLRGNGGNDRLLGDDGRDLLEGGTGSDNLYGDAGDDTLNGGAGNDYLTDTLGGSDTFVFERGSGVDTIYSYNPNNQNNSQADVLLMGANITINDISIRRNYSNLVISINGTNDQVTVQYYFSADAYKLGEIRFANGTALSRFDIEERLLVGTEGSDQIYGNSANNNLKGLGGNDTLNGGAGNDTLEGGAGYDYLYGGDGNDLLLGGAGDDYLRGDYGNNTLDGGAGNDVYYGGRGDDTFIFTKGSGKDIVYNYNSFGTDALRDKILLQGLLKTDVTLTRNNYNLEVTVNGTNGADKLTIPNYFYANFANYNCAYAISRLVFADGSEYNASQIRDLVANGQSVIEGSPNSDVLIGSSFNETIRGNDKDDTLLAYEGSDTLLGNNGKDSLFGGQGNDTLDGGAGNDWLQGDLGADVYRFGRGGGQDTIYNFDEDALNVNVDSIVLGDGIAESDITVSKDGEDLVLSIKNTTDSLRIQNYLRNNATTAFAVENIVFASGTTWSINTVRQKLSPNSNLLLQGGSGNDVLIAGSGQDTLQGGAGNDELYGAAGNDLLEGGLDNDKLYGETGNDTLIGGAGNDSYYLDDDDTIIENANEGIDTLYVSSTVVAAGTDYQIVDNLENVVVTGTQSLRVLGNASNNNMVANNAGGLLFGGAGNDTLLGGTAQDLLIGGDGDDLVEGGAGDDRLQGNNGNNILRGGDGSDYYIMSNLLNINETGLDIIQNYDNDAINTNADRIQLFDITSDKITVKREADHLLIQSSPTKTIRVENYFASEGATSAAVEWIDFVDFAQNKIVESWDIATVKAKVLLGTSANEALTGYSSDDVLKGNGGNDTLNGKGGNDIIEGEIGNDTLLGEEGNDVLNGGEGNDTLNGGLGNDVLGGGVGNDSLLGGDGNDIFEGGVGADTMEGGAGDDIYAVDDVADVVTETVTGVSTAGNIIRVNTAADGSQANRTSYEATFSADGKKIVFQSYASNLVAGDTNQSIDIFVKDLTTDAVTRVNTAADGSQANNDSSNATFSPDGKKIVFQSYASNLVAGDTNQSIDI
ncbi:MAG: PD40 domain-containing protein, partial [Pseudomonadales bacterium]|nr:PD40 domain-containing protein [Pseudomonadales bacterium]